MAIQPIDLQTLYTQLEKIGKQQVQQQVVAQAERESEMTTNRAEAERRLKTVHHAEAGDEHAGKVHEWNGNKSQEHAPSSEERKEAKDEEQKGAPAEAEKEVIRDPALGTHIDISG